MHLLNCKEYTTHLAMGDIERQPMSRRWMFHFHRLICYVCSRYEKQLNHISSAFRTRIHELEKSQNMDQFKRRMIDELRGS